MSRGALRGPGGKEGSSSMMLKGSQVMNPRKLHRKITALQLAGRTDHEIAETLGVSSSTVRYVASLYLSDAAAEYHSRSSQVDQRPRLAYEMRHEGKSFAEIGQTLNISRPRAHQIVHRYEWRLRRLRRGGVLEH